MGFRIYTGNDESKYYECCDLEEVKKVKKYLSDKGITDITVVKVIIKVKNVIKKVTIDTDSDDDSNCGIINFGTIGNINNN